MCCDGTLFEGAVVADNEIDHVVSLSLTLKRRADGVMTFDQPCPAFAGGCCSVYEQRPGSCRAYNCKLVREYTSGRMSTDECLDIIEIMRGLTTWMQEAMEVTDGSFSAGQLGEYMSANVTTQQLGANQDLATAGYRYSQVVAEYFGDTPVARRFLATARAAHGRVSAAP